MAKSRRGAAPAPWRVLIASGANLDLLGQREPAVYGHATLAAMEALLATEAPALAAAAGAPGVALSFFQTNHEGEYLDKLGDGWAGAVLNPGAWTHTSLALGDRLAALGLPFVEAHLSNLARREELRHRSFAAPHAVGVVYGFGIESYLVALTGLLRHLGRRPPPP